MRRTKIICTMGPACNSRDILKSLIIGGMDAARFNLSHGSHNSHAAQLALLREAAGELNAPIATILDTKGPEIRISGLEVPVELTTGDEFTLTTRKVTGGRRIASVTYAGLHEELPPNCRILIDDGQIALRVEEIQGRDILCIVTNGGTLSPNKSINIPDVRINLPSLTDWDRADIRFAVENGFDYIAASFVRRAADLADIRAYLHTCGGADIAIIAKIENSEGVQNADEIVASADGIMVARGDLGVELPAHEVPVIQKRLVAKCAEAGKPVIIATQMLDSMIRNPRPTRAEVSDIANAVFEFAGCVMLSGETASGKYPAASLRVMVETLNAAENSMEYWRHFLSKRSESDGTISGAISRSCCLTAMDLGARAILAATTSGHTAKMIARYKPGCRIIALTTSERVRRQLSLYWGVRADLIPHAGSTDELIDMCVARGKSTGYIEPGDAVIITAGVPVGVCGTTNLIKAQIVE